MRTVIGRLTRRDVHRHRPPMTPRAPAANRGSAPAGTTAPPYPASRPLSGARGPAALTAAAFAAVALAGCAPAQPVEAQAEPIALAVVISPHANAPAPQVTDSLRRALQDAVASRGYVTVVVNDGEPSLIEGGGAAVGSEAKTERMVREANAKQVASLEGLLTSQRAQAPENAPLQALTLAARDLAGKAGSKRIVIQDSGLQTVPPMSFTAEDQLSSDAQDVANFLAEAGEIPDLAGIGITWSGLGDTAAPQAGLDRPARTNLQRIWEAVLTMAGAQVTFDPSPMANPPATGLPAVSAVPVPKPVQLPEVCTPKNFVLTNSAVRFVGDKAEYADPEMVLRVLRPLAERISDEGLTVHLIGTTASGPTKDFLAQLSLDRAKKVRDSLIELGVPAAAITAEGQGMDDRWHVDDLDEQGRLIPRLAAQNRKVVMVISGTTVC